MSKSKSGHLTIHEVSDITGLSTGTLYWHRYNDSGPPSYKIGKFLVYPEQELMQWLDARVASTLRGTVFPGRPATLPPRASLVSSIHRSFSPLSESL
jgi:predicted DNA-binding transcriptional regulator AlpA